MKHILYYRGTFLIQPPKFTTDVKWVQERPEKWGGIIDWRKNIIVLFHVLEYLEIFINTEVLETRTTRSHESRLNAFK